ncbi:MAG: DegT/DnrJ/EryC1/StrS family aminotransferase [Eubacteriales bacterium]|nr:DegT/DnrJ/EryC1/StrS family aminotransferase [Eubacteriales bacterium]
MSEIINVTRSSMPDYEEFCAEIKDMWETHWLTNMGVKHQTLEKELKEYLDVPYITLFTNGHLALENMLEGIGVKGEIITTPYTFASTTHAIVRTGNTPVFCDINDEDYTIDVNRIEALITEKTVAIMPVHVYGNLCDTEAIDRIAKKYGLKVLYDAAHAFGVRKNGVSSAAMGDVSMFSFHATKVFNTIEGGALCYNDGKLERVFADLKNFGIHGPESVTYVGGNAKMNEFCAAMGLCNLRHLDEEIAKRKVAAERYDERLGNVKGIKLNKRQSGVESNYAYYPAVFDGYKYTRDEIFDRLAAENIIARKYFYPITNSFECYRGRPGFDVDDTPVAKHIGDSVLTLPMYADLSVETVDRICGIILK